MRTAIAASHSPSSADTRTPFRISPASSRSIRICRLRALQPRDLLRADRSGRSRDRRHLAAIEIEPRAEYRFERRGTIHFRKNLLDKALADYEQALVINPQYPSALYGRGIIRTRKGDLAGGGADIAAATRSQAEHRRGNGPRRRQIVTPDVPPGRRRICMNPRRRNPMRRLPPYGLQRFSSARLPALNTHPPPAGHVLQSGSHPIATRHRNESRPRAHPHAGIPHPRGRGLPRGGDLGRARPEGRRNDRRHRPRDGRNHAARHS